MVNENGNTIWEELKDNLIGLLIVIVVIFIGIKIYNFISDKRESDTPKITLINVDEKEGLILLGEISTLDFNEMTEKYGKPSRLYDLTSTSGRYWCEWDNIKIKKEGIPIWCNLSTSYTSRTNVYSTWKTYNCK